MYIHLTVPPVCKTKFYQLNTLSNTHDHNTRHCDLIRIDKCSFPTTQNNFYYMSTKLFNSLPPSTRALKFVSFKNCVKSILYEQCFYNLNEYFNYVKNVVK